VVCESLPYHTAAPAARLLLPQRHASNDVQQSIHECRHCVVHSMHLVKQGVAASQPAGPTQRGKQALSTASSAALFV
jgi:hypothetical protein